MRPPLSRMPAMPVALGFTLGILATEWSLGWPCAAISAIAFIALYARHWHYAAFIALAAAAGAILAIARAPVPSPLGDDGDLTACAGQIINSSIGENTQRCVVKIDSVNGLPCTRPFKCVVFNRHISPGMLPGTRVRFSAEIIPISESEGLLPHETDYGKYLKYEGISSRAVIYNESLEPCGKPGLWHRVVNSVRESMANGISKSGVTPQTSAFLLTVLLGEDDFLNPDIRTGFQTAGLSHILALSGLHVGIIASFLIVLLFPLRILPCGRKAQSVIVILLIWVYTIATGLSPSVTRAAVMLSALIAARIIERGNFSFNALFTALIVVLAINPYSLFTPGLQMSFSAVAAILLASRILPKKLASRPIAAFLTGLAVVPCAAMLGTGIIGAYYFHSFPLLFLPANIAMGLLFPILLIAGVALMLTSMAGAHFTFLTSAANFLYGMVIDTAGAFSHSPALQVIFFSAWIIAPYWIGLILIFEYLRLRLNDGDEYNRKKNGFLIWGSAFMLSAIALGLALTKRLPKAELYSPDIYPQCIVLSTQQHAYLIPVGKSIDTADVLDRYNARYSAFLMNRGHERFEIMPDKASLGPFHRNGAFLLAKDRLIVIADSDTVPPFPMHPFRIMIGRGFGKKLSRIASRGDTIIFCRGINGNRKNLLQSQCSDTIFVDYAPLSLVHR